MESFEHMHFWHLQPVSMHFYYAFLAIDFAFGIHGLVPGQQLIILHSFRQGWTKQNKHRESVSFFLPPIRNLVIGRLESLEACWSTQRGIGRIGHQGQGCPATATEIIVHHWVWYIHTHIIYIYIHIYIYIYIHNMYIYIYNTVIYSIW